MRVFETYNFTAPVNQAHLVMVDFAKPVDAVSQEDNSRKQEVIETESDEDDTRAEEDIDLSREKDISNPPADPEIPRPKQNPVDTANTTAKKIEPLVNNNEAASAKSSDKSGQSSTADPASPELHKVSDFLTSKNEKLTYMISVLGLPVGSAELESKNEYGDVWITLKVKSSSAISTIFPVDDLIETRHIDGKFIMTKIKQQEGSFRSDEGFTINLMKKRVFWVDNIGNRSLKMTVPTDRVLDTLSGIYYLRNRPLEIGRTEILHIYDTETYAEVPVEILRRETIRLLNFQSVDALVVRPLQKTPGIFRRTGDILIWMTDDAFKVPVKIVTSIALGKITVELVSAESTPLEEVYKAKK